MTCDEWAAAYLAGGSTPQGEAHLRGCADCRRAQPRLDVLRRQLAEQAVWEVPGPDLGDEVLERIRAGTAAAAAPRPARPRLRQRRRGVWLAGVAAAVLAALGGWAASSRPGGPDWRLELEAAASTPAAEAVVEGWNGPTGTRIRLDVRGVAPSGDDAYYALWLTSPDGRHVPAATFRGPGTVDAWAGVARADFPRVWVTLEPADADETLSGPTVLDTPGYG